MRNGFLILVVASLGALVGGGTVWIHSYGDNDVLTDQQQLLEAIFLHSGTLILEENYSCEGSPIKSVGAVVASILESNRLHKRNSLVYGCYESICTMSVSDCKPWQANECGSRFLKFSLRADGKIEPSSFSCIDIP